MSVCGDSVVVSAPCPAHTCEGDGVRVHVYGSAAEMGLASAVGIASAQCRLVAENGTTSMIVMAAPSAYAFYESYIRLVQSSAELQRALRATHLFQFDDYPLPFHHPASFRALLLQRLIMPLAPHCDPAKVHLLEADSHKPDAACAEYGRSVLAQGPDLQLKGLGENGHWGFHEPGLPIDGEPAFIKVRLSEENVAQQMRDHPFLFGSPDAVPKEAYTGNVPLFLRTRRLIEENVPQPSKAFALLAAYGSEVVDACVPSSALKRHPNAVVRTTESAAWALLEYRRMGVVKAESLRRLVTALLPDTEGDPLACLNRVMDVLTRMRIRCEGGDAHV